MNKRLLIFSVLVLSSTIAHSGTLQTKESHHNHTEVVTLKGDVARLNADLLRDEARIASLESSMAGMDKAEMMAMRESIGRHNVFFAILTGFVSVITVAIVGEIVRRWLSLKT